MEIFRAIFFTSITSRTILNVHERFVADRSDSGWTLMLLEYPDTSMLYDHLSKTQRNPYFMHSPRIYPNFRDR